MINDRHAWDLHQQSFIKGLWIGWAIGTAFLMPIVILVVTNE